MLGTEKLTGLTVEATQEAVVRLWDQEDDGTWTSVVYLAGDAAPMPGRMIGTVKGVGEGSKRRFKHSEMGSDADGKKRAKDAILDLVATVTDSTVVEEPPKKAGRKTSKKK